MDSCLAFRLIAAAAVVVGVAVVLVPAWNDTTPVNDPVSDIVLQSSGGAPDGGKRI